VGWLKRRVTIDKRWKKIYVYNILILNLICVFINLIKEWQKWNEFNFHRNSLKHFCRSTYIDHTNLKYLYGCIIDAGINKFNKCFKKYSWTFLYDKELIFRTYNVMNKIWLYLKENEVILKDSNDFLRELKTLLLL